MPRIDFRYGTATTAARTGYTTGIWIKIPDWAPSIAWLKDDTTPSVRDNEGVIRTVGSTTSHPAAVTVCRVLEYDKNGRYFRLYQGFTDPDTAYTMYYRSMNENAEVTV